MQQREEQIRWKLEWKWPNGILLAEELNNTRRFICNLNNGNEDIHNCSLMTLNKFGWLEYKHNVII
jgi:hypothetical protein